MVRRPLPAACALAFALAFGFVARDANALDLPKLFKNPLRLDVTEVSIISQRFLARDDNKPQDFGWGQWINRLNASLVWTRLTVGVRLDSALYWNRPIDQPDSNVPKNPGLERDDTGRYRNSIYPAKLFVTYNAPGVEITLVDAYVQMTRGLVLSMRKLDDLGIDNTIRGAKIAITKGPFAVTVVGGYANPSRVDEATGYSLFLPKPTTGDTRSPQPVFGSDHILAAEIQGGRGTPVVLSTAIANFTRCAPYAYFPSGAIKQDGTFFAEFGHCSDDVSDQPLGTPPPTPTWLAGQNGFNRAARYVTNLSQSIEFPKLGPLGTLYIAGVIQQRSFIDSDQNDTGSAFYASYSGNYGPVTNTFEVKSYRNFFPVQAAVDSTRVSAFEPIAYSQPPTGEVITQDSAFGNFNACVDGGRLRTDIRMSKRLLTYFQAIYAHSKTELVSGRCNTAGTQVGGSSGQNPAELTNDMWDGLGGIQYEFDQAKSYLYSTIGVRSDTKGTGEPYYHQGEFTYTFSKYLGKQVSLEFIGRHRIRYYETDNIRRDDNGVERAIPWAEGENYTAIKIAPKWVFSQGIEYTSRLGYSSLYINGGVLYRFTKDSNIRLFAGQQRGGLRCVSGVCRVFPAFEGARLEVTVRF
ncbi:hypothetical protein BH09MYX1_BH09MYX1_21360 [soil metagenome]